MKDRRVLHDGDMKRFGWLIRVETICLLIVLVLLLLIAIVGVYYEREQIFTNDGMIIVFAATLGELTRRARHVATDYRPRPPGPDPKEPPA